ncbi:MAG: CHAD domain-containing protein [Betaproteobacteria bacterium]
MRAIKANPLWAGGEFGASRRCAASECSPVAPTCKVRQARTRPPVAGAHRAGILAKRLRYGIEALRPLLGKRRAHHGYEEAVERQGCIGTRRDLQQALALLDRLDADPGLREVVRGGAADVGLSR